ncbi:bifunctional peptidase and (3S)-lysyl hydroxylase JMJD7-like isoform X2 [Zingiber officinale]|uniref:bifunctional peptidase and (3S)-lysyl hydroxylase JMJD7-like isoform X2 n=1 Tax=Zingiber officinale TaxID=94328 RepID=UPI001C4DCD49|nr:bifunctional peptidase and (3S)-lysyl hydroxylase JMJD7-like isoform X2 [Zingiber officinale]
MDSSLLARRFDERPSPADFSSKIEPTNVPAVFHGAVKEWRAITRWNPFDGGLDYLEERAGSAVLEAMLSRSGHVFYGDIRSHERVPISFSTFITSCKKFLQTSDARSTSAPPAMSLATSACLEDASSDILGELYVAQVPILNLEDKERCPLRILAEDIQTPIFLQTSTLASINFWMNMAKSRSSTHYDPHHNLLCMVSGCKKVILWPPSACPILYPMAVYGEASNHSAVSIEKPDLSLHPRAVHYEESSQKIILRPGDVLFIPEGWFHQVDSDDLTIAVNFWWKSDMMSNMVEHMDAYYLRRILNRLVAKEMNQTLHEQTGGSSMEKYQPCSEATEGNHGSDHYKLRDNPKENGKSNGILQQLEPCGLDMQNFPRTLEALILYMLSPKGAEVLTRKFDEMDQQTNKEAQAEFYRLFYSVFDDQFAAMDVILNGKESFAFQAFKNVLDNYAGVHLGRPNK